MSFFDEEVNVDKTVKKLSQYLRDMKFKDCVKKSMSNMDGYRFPTDPLPCDSSEYDKVIGTLKKLCRYPHILYNIIMNAPDYLHSSTNRSGVLKDINVVDDGDSIDITENLYWLRTIIKLLIDIKHLM